MRPFRLLTPSLILLASCVEPYEPTLSTETFNILVVDGFINTTDNSAVVKLSRAVSVSAEAPPLQEIVATVNIEDDAGTTFTLNDQGMGYFSLEDMTLDPSRKYRLHIYSQYDEEVFSDYIEIITSPPIDSVLWRPDRDGISIYVNTHDPSGKSVYYSWNYEETWEYSSTFYSNYKIIDGVVYPRSSDDQIYQCWSTNSSTKILIASTTTLSEDVVRDFPLLYLPPESSKIAKRYSILVEQRVLSKAAYDFWVELEKTTESLGGLFDPLPSQVLGNIKSNNPNSAEPVLGYFSGGSVATERLFINFVDLPHNIQSVTRLPYCKKEDITGLSLAEIPSLPNSVLLIDEIYVQGIGIVGYRTAPYYCIDCQVFGGTTKQPDFW